MPKLIKKVIKGRKQFDYEHYSKASTQLWDHVSENPKKVPANTDTEEFAKKIDALSMHLAGMPLKDAALTVCISPAALYSFKCQWLRKDSSLAAVLANLLEASAVQSLVVFNKKKDSMDASEAMSAAATATKAAVHLRQGANTNYQTPENVALETLDRIGKVLELADKHKQLKNVKVIDQ